MKPVLACFGCLRPYFARGRTRPLRLLLVLVSLLVACESTPEKPEGIVVAVYTDLAVGTQLTSLTATLMDGDQPTEGEHTFTFPHALGGGSNFLVSFGVQRGGSGIMRLKLTGFRANEGAPPTPVIEQTLSARFIQGKTGLVKTLLSANCFEVLGCGDLTCDPMAGSCVPVVDSPVQLRDTPNEEEITWLPSGYARKPPENQLDSELDDGGTRADSGSDGGDGDSSVRNPCQSGDTVCPLECGSENDSDCPRPAGATCALAEQCESAICTGNYCCATARSDVHVATPSCQGGSCQAGICEEHYGDCNADKATDGCETSLVADAKHCGSCENECPYGVCLDSNCAFATQGSQNKDAHFTYTAGEVHGFKVPSINTGKLASIGILIHQPNDAQVHFALFEVGPLDSAYPRLIATEEPVNVDNRDVAEWIIPEAQRVDVQGMGGAKDYWVFFTFSKNTSVYASNEIADFWASTDPPEFVPIAEERPNDEYSTGQDGLPYPSVFFTVVPSMSPTW